MPALAIAYLEELAEGFVPAPDSAEAKAYQTWSRQYEWARRQALVMSIVAGSITRVYGDDKASILYA